MADGEDIPFLIISYEDENDKSFGAMLHDGLAIGGCTGTDQGRIVSEGTFRSMPFAE